MVIKLIKITNS